LFLKTLLFCSQIYSPSIPEKAAFSMLKNQKGQTCLTTLSREKAVIKIQIRYGQSDKVQ
jgi:hypothetical protein